MSLRNSNKMSIYSCRILCNRIAGARKDLDDNDCMGTFSRLNSNLCELGWIQINFSAVKVKHDTQNCKSVSWVAESRLGDSSCSGGFDGFKFICHSLRSKVNHHFSDIKSLISCLCGKSSIKTMECPSDSVVISIEGSSDGGYHCTCQINLWWMSEVS